MTAQEKAKFVCNLCNSLRNDILSAVPDMPEDWDGHELRELIADEFNRERTDCVRKDRKRKRAYGAAKAGLNI